MLCGSSTPQCQAARAAAAAPSQVVCCLAPLTATHTAQQQRSKHTRSFATHACSSHVVHSTQAALHVLPGCPPLVARQCQHSRSNSWVSQRRNDNSSRACQARVFDKLKDMFGGSSGNNTGDNTPDANQQQQEDGYEEDDDGSDMLRIDQGSSRSLDGSTEEAFGPLAVLLVGFMQQEVDAFKALMNDMDADIVKCIPCTKAMLGLPLLQVFDTQYPQYEQPPLGQRRAMFFSGMYGSEVTEVIAAYRDAGLPPCVFAGLVPNNANRTVGELMDAVWRDHSAMLAKMQQQQLEREGGGEGARDSY